MKEIKEIIAAYDRASAAGQKTALATVVHVEGSSYRRAGARMLVTEDGVITGAISGGCLEGDALRKALHAIHQQKNKLVTYDTTDDDNTLGVQLGCNGIVHILFEPLTNDTTNAVHLLKDVQSQRSPSALVTLFSLANPERQPGTIASIGPERHQSTFSHFDREFLDRSIQDARRVLSSGESEVINYPASDLTSSVQVVKPAISLVVFGAGNDAIPLINIASILGWETTVVDGRPTHANKIRFPLADRIVVAKAQESTGNVAIDGLTACVLMSHNYNYDIAVLSRLLATDCKYIGVLGPKKKFDKMMDDLAAGGAPLTSQDLEKIYSPVGLDVSAETSEEIALSISAEIQAVLTGSPAQSLRVKPGPIHLRKEHKPTEQPST